MATYKGIHGYRVESLSSDPPAATSLGQVWYNTTSAVLKYSVEGAGAWAAGTAFTTTRASPGVAGITTAALIFAGNTTTPQTLTVNTETWNGSSWTEVGNLPTAREASGGFGTSTAAVNAGGYNPPTNTACDKWDGTSWTATGVLNTGTQMMGSGGTQTAGMKFGGDDYDDETEIFDGSTWTEVGDLNLARKSGAPSTNGTTTAMLFAGGEVGPAYPPRRSGETETWDGTSWTEVADLNTDRSAGCGCGTSTAALCFGGQYAATPNLAVKTESWDGTSWTEVADLATGVQNMRGIGTSTSAFSCGGNTAPGAPGFTNAVEEWADPSYVIKTVTSS